MNPGGSLVEPWWNPGGTLVEPSCNLTSGPPRTTPEPIWAETPKLSAVGQKTLFQIQKQQDVSMPTFTKLSLGTSPSCSEIYDAESSRGLYCWTCQSFKLTRQSHVKPISEKTVNLESHSNSSGSSRSPMSPSTHGSLQRSSGGHPSWPGKRKG